MIKYIILNLAYILVVILTQTFFIIYHTSINLQTQNLHVEIKDIAITIKLSQGSFLSMIRFSEQYYTNAFNVTFCKPKNKKKQHKFRAKSIVSKQRGGIDTLSVQLKNYISSDLSRTVLACVLAINKHRAWHNYKYFKKNA